MPWKEILEGVKKSLGIKEKEKPSPFKFSPERATAETKRMPDVVWEYIKQKRKGLVEPAKPIPPTFEPIKPLPTPRFETFVPTPAAPIPCGGTCAAGRAQMLEQEIAIKPRVLSPLDIGQPVGKEESWYEAQSKKIGEWTEKVAAKEETEEKKRWSDLAKEHGLPWDQAQQKLPWDREAQAMKEHMAVVKDLKETEKRLVMTELPWQRAKQEVGLAEAVDLTRERLQIAHQVKIAEANERGREPSEHLSTDEEEALDELLEAIALHYDKKYEPMRETIRRLPLKAEEKEYLGEQFQDQFEPDYDVLTPQRQKEMANLAKDLWEKHKGEYYNAREELYKMRDTLAIDVVESSAVDDQLEDWRDKQQKEKRQREEAIKHEALRKIATGYRVQGMDLDQLAEHLFKEFKEAYAATEQLEKLKLPDREEEYVSSKLRDLESKKLDKIFELADQAADENNEGYYGLLHRIEEHDELTEEQKESILEDIHMDMDQVTNEEMSNIVGTSWDHQILQVKRKVEDEIIDEAIAEQLIDYLDSNKAEEESQLEEAGLTNLSVEERLRKIDELQVPADMKETLENLVQDIADREELTKKEVDKEQREARLREKIKKGGGEVHEKRPSGYIFHFKAKGKKD